MQKNNRNITTFLPPYHGLAAALRSEVAELANPIILCIGSDRLTGDCLGPLVGSALTREHNVPTYVYGTLHRTVTALNLNDTLSFIRTRHPDSTLIVVDACLGGEADVGSIRLLRGGIRAGSASGKKFRPCGDLAVTAVVNRMPASTLSSTKLGFVSDLAGVISVTLAAAIAVRSSSTPVIA